MVQTKTVGSTLSSLWLPGADHARMPVMWPHKSDSKVRRDGSNAASMQPENAVTERGRLHGVPDLDAKRLQHAPAWKRTRFTAIERNRRWRIPCTTNGQLRRRDKRSAVGSLYVVVSPSHFEPLMHHALPSPGPNYSLESRQIATASLDIAALALLASNPCAVMLTSDIRDFSAQFFQRQWRPHGDL